MPVAATEMIFPLFLEHSESFAIQLRFINLLVSMILWIPLSACGLPTYCCN
jgi:hypothetical protein